MSLFDDQELRRLVREIVADVVRDQLLPALDQRRPAHVERLLPIAEVQEVLGSGWDTVDRLLRDGELEAVQVRGHRKVTAASLAAYIDRNRIPTSRPRAVSA